MPASQVKPFDISKQQVWEAYRQVAANKGAPGVDGQDLEVFEADSKDNLYKISEPDELRVLLPAPGQGRGDTKAAQQRHPFARRAHSRR